MGAVTSVERGRLVTVAVAINVQWGHIVPFFEFTLMRYQDNMIRKGPITCVTTGNPPLLTKNVCCCPTIMYHMSLFVPLITAQQMESFFVILSPQHRQNAPAAIFKLFMKIINKATNNWKRNHPGLTMTIHYLPDIVEEAVPFAVPYRNAIGDFTLSTFNR